MAAFKVWDTISLNEEHDMTDAISCDYCAKKVTKPFYYSFLGYPSMALCTGCFSNETMNKIFKVEVIDRLDKTEATNPRKWPCIFCKFLLGGGYKWITVKHTFPDSYSDPTIWDICNSCSESRCFLDLNSEVNTIDLNLAALCACFMQLDKDCQIISSRSGNDNVIDFRDCTDKLALEKLPDSIVSQITRERMERYASSIPDLFSVTKTLNLIPLGSVKQWAQFTDDSEIPFHTTSTALLVDCHKDTLGRIASMSIGYQGETNINVIFNNINEYQEALNAWTSLRLDTQSQEYKDLYAKVEKEFNDTGSNDDEHAKICTTFSSYIRLAKRLPLDDY